MLKVALLGRPNVGKSTLFNALSCTREALVADIPGLTRDRRYGVAEYETEAGQSVQWLLIDTGGVAFGDSEIDQQVWEQTQLAVQESDVVCLVVSAEQGMVPLDCALLEQLRRLKKKIWLVVNKLDGRDEALVLSEFAEMGIQESFGITALRRRRIKLFCEALAQAALEKPDVLPPQEQHKQAISIAFIGRPNVGKSTLVNRILGTQRLITSDESGTTRDSIAVAFEDRGREFLLIDTAGVRRKKATQSAEVLSVLHALENALLARVVVLVCDATEAVTRQDAILAGRILEAGCALIVVLNKIDCVDSQQQHILKASVHQHLGFLQGFDIFTVSALHNQGIQRILNSAYHANQAATTRVSTPQCNRLLQKAQQQHHPPRTSGGMVKLRYAHQGGIHPPRFIVFGSRVEGLQPSYRRYLENFFRRQLKLKGTPVFFEFRQTPNPYQAKSSQAKHRSH